ncbi:acyl-CoA dehydrogenase [Mycolicibacterium moriokaense]|nr:acyl-CoA dehydrogenase [Mycolicibacterium moriokaense]
MRVVAPKKDICLSLCVTAEAGTDTRVAESARSKTLHPDEAADLTRAVRGLCERMANESRVREVAHDRTDSRARGVDAELWHVLCEQLGVAGIEVPEQLGGAGYGASALGVVAHELGRTLAPVPFLASAVLAVGLLHDCLDVCPHAAQTLPLASLLDGQRTAALVAALDGGFWQPGSQTVEATGDDDIVLTGVARHVLNGSGADDLVVIAEHDGRLGVYWLDADSAGVERVVEPVLDGTRPMATIAFNAASAVTLTSDPRLADVIARRIDIAISVLSAEQVGANERLLELAVDYAGARHQFGRAIGSFQAVKHRCADMLIDLEWSRSASQAALLAADDHPTGAAAELHWRASMAKAVCSESLRAAGHANLQIHGGIGFTWEDCAHLYLKRARTDEVLFGSPAAHWDRLGVAAGVGDPERR